MKRGLLRRIVPVASAVLLAGTLAACETGPTSYAYPTNPNATYGQVERDRMDCEAWARS
ncbi:MAG: hypothetical protein UV51_C0017G0011 [Candidatus Woesebacteria bacterium GW2011_GWC1_42_9]|nr:MAG: hypothetical protein UV51_C0017G0011 [Candidatus Woesebacteria bacterium GW2011_GWC1_42_9]